jgi:gamma-glutamyl:cysteine ligase YbdK (ATP-grasp superfamily)
MHVTPTSRYQQMLADYQLLAREQLICGTQVHVGVEDRDESVLVAGRVAAYVPTLLALSASSPFWSDGSDTGYCSVRTGLAAMADHRFGSAGCVGRRVRHTDLRPGCHRCDQRCRDGLL